jgi:Domain of unknown function (DUF5666)
MHKVYAVFSTAAMIALSLSVAACGKSNSPVSPTTSAPAAQPAPAPVPSGASTGASITGTVVAASTTSSLRTASSFRTMSVGLTVTIVGTSMITTVDGAGNFSFHDVPDGDDVLEFQGPGVDARMPIAGVTDHEDIHLTVVVNGTTVDVDTNERHTPDSRVEIEGRIAALNAAPPTLQIGTTTVSVPAGTPIEHGDTAIAFSALVVGERVHVHATNIGGTITATSVEVQTDNPGNPGPPVTPTPDPGDGNDHGNNNSEVHGALAAKAGTCPSITFTVGSTNVSTNASTEFKDVACSALAIGDSVEVQGTRQTNGSILASRVEKDK